MRACITLVLIAVASFTAVRAQTSVSPYAGAIDSILRDFPNHLRHITGELVLAQGEFDNYSSMVRLPGAADCVITRWHSTADSSASWQASMYRGDDFTAAERCYRQLFRQLENCYLRMEDSSLAYLKGSLEPAKEEASFTTSTLRLGIDDWRYREVQVDVELVYLLTDWAVRIDIVSKRPDDETPAGAAASGQ